MRQVLVTGASGQVGTELQRCAWPESWEAVAVGRDSLDLANAEAIAAKVLERPWAAVINAGAYTAVDKAEGDQVAAWRINALAAAALADACAKGGVPVVHISTDYVFPGDKQGSWVEGDSTGPLGVYGASKLAGELAVRASGARHAIVRTAWVVSAQGSNFVKTMLRVGAERGHLRVVDDQVGSPTGAADLARALATMAMRLADEPDRPAGTFHFANTGGISWAGFAAEIFRQSALRGGPTATVEPIATADFPMAARRPANSLLDCSAIGAAYGIVPRPWQEALGDILDELIGPAQ